MAKKTKVTDNQQLHDAQTTIIQLKLQGVQRDFQLLEKYAGELVAELKAHTKASDKAQFDQNRLIFVEPNNDDSKSAVSR